MSRIAYVNGRYVAHRDALVHVEDRGYQFADGVYEVCEVFRGSIVDLTRHLDRLDRSMSEIEIRPPRERAALAAIVREVVRRNRVGDGLVYIQVTRGAARREHVFPPASTPAALVVTARWADREAADALAAEGVGVITVPENRWARVDIKSVSLLPNVLAKERARRAGAKEAWFVDADGNITEGASTNAWIVTTDGKLVTRPADHGILRGITRQAVFELAARDGLELDERPFSVEEARRAREAFMTAATTVVMPVVQIDDNIIGNGRPGSVATGLRAHFHEIVERVAVAGRVV